MNVTVSNLQPEVRPQDRNSLVADRLREAATLLQEQGASHFRVRAYQRAADTVGGLSRDVGQILEQDGVAGLDALAGFGRGIAAAIEQLVRTGGWAMLDRLRGGTDPEPLLRTVPGIGPVLARRLHDELHVDSLPAQIPRSRTGSAAPATGSWSTSTPTTSPKDSGPS